MSSNDTTYIPPQDRDFFLLLRAGLWQKVEEPLSDTPDWSYIYTLACEQTVQGIVADGIGLYKSAYKENLPPSSGEALFLNQSAQIVRQNYKLNQVQSKICQLLNTHLPVETKTIKTPSSTAGSANPTLDESSVPSENKLSPATANSSNGISSDAAIANGDKQEINNSFESTDSTDVSQVGPIKACNEVAETNKNVFCGNATGLSPDGNAKTSAGGCDMSDGFYQEACLLGKDNAQVAQETEGNDCIDRRGFSGFCQNKNSGSDFCQNSNQEASFVILKGQGVAQCYPKPLLRCSGDIDIYFSKTDYQKAKALLIPQSTSVEDKPLSLECALTIDDCIVELHGSMSCGINNACQRHFDILSLDVLSGARKIDINGHDIVVPSANFDAIYILIHTIRHLGSFGISLRQVIDWTMHMHANRDIIDRERLQYDIQQMHLHNLWTLFSSFAIHYLGAPQEDFELGSDNNVFCGAATGLSPDAVVNPSMGCDVDGGLTMGARSQSQTDIHSTQSDSENNSSRGFSGFCQNQNNSESGSCQHTNLSVSTPLPKGGGAGGEASLWQLIAQSGSFGKKNPYFKHLHAGKLNERLARIYYHIKQALVLRQFDSEFSHFLLKKELRDVIVSPFRFLFGGKTKNKAFDKNIKNNLAS